MKTKTPYAPFLTSYAFGPLPKHILEPLALNNPGDFRKTDFNFAPTVVSGAFTFGKWDKTQQVVLNANLKYFRGRPNVDSWVIKNVGTDDAAVNQVKTGEVDVTGVTPSLWDDLAAVADKVERISFVASSYEYYGYNTDPSNPKRPVSGKIFGDPQTGKLVRQALYHAIERALAYGLHHRDGTDRNAQSYYVHSVWLVILPGLCIFITVLASNLFGNAVRDAFDPRLR